VGTGRQPPSVEHWFGTNQVGMDVFSRTVFGTRIATQFGLLVACLSTVIGVGIGAAIGMVEHRRSIMGRLGRTLNDLNGYVIAIPDIITGIVVVGVMGPSPTAITIALVLVLVQPPIKLTRVEVLKVRNESYLEMAHLSGESPLRAAIV